MRNYKSEFSLDFELGFDLLMYPWLVDKSWHNDVCPSFVISAEQGYFVLWTDFKDTKRRESEQYRYIIMSATNDGTNDDPEIYHDDKSQVVFSSESSTDLIMYLNKIKLAN